VLTCGTCLKDAYEVITVDYNTLYISGYMYTTLTLSQLNIKFHVRIQNIASALGFKNIQCVNIFTLLQQ